MNDRKQAIAEFEKLLDILDQLREKCPWDKKQTFETLRKLTIEETYELADAISSGSNDAICGELGDIALHLAFYAKIGAEKGAFTLADVFSRINSKLIYRHPHVFGNAEAKTATQVEANWEKLKTREDGAYKPVLSGVPAALPAVVKANRIQEKARGAGFDWEKPEHVWPKVDEELTELKDEIAADNHNAIEDEFGDLMFSVINAARLYGIDPEAALEKTNRKFIKRFNYLEQETIAAGKYLADMSLDEMNAIWEKAKTVV